MGTEVRSVRAEARMHMFVGLRRTFSHIVILRMMRAGFGPCPLEAIFGTGFHVVLGQKMRYEVLWVS